MHFQIEITESKTKPVICMAVNCRLLIAPTSALTVVTEGHEKAPTLFLKETL